MRSKCIIYIYSVCSGIDWPSQLDLKGATRSRCLLLAKFPMPELELVVATACGVLVPAKTISLEGC